jgi:hypothetical protein
VAELSRVICPFVGKPRAKTRAALDGQAPDRVEYVDVSGSPTAYFELIRRLWGEQRSFILVEHDIVPPAGALEALEACGHSWCSAPPATRHDGSSRDLRAWTARGRKAAQLTCNRFDRALMVGLPKACVLRPGLQHWGNVAEGLLSKLERSGASCHVHLDLVTKHLARRSAATQDARNRERTEWAIEHSSPESLMRRHYVARS